jgi:hypothetical protein
MAKQRVARKKLPRTPHADTSQYVDDGILDVTEEGYEDRRYNRLSEGCMELSGGGFLRMRPPGFGPDFDSGSAYVD